MHTTMSPIGPVAIPATTSTDVNGAVNDVLRSKRLDGVFMETNVSSAFAMSSKDHDTDVALTEEVAVTIF